MTTKVAIDKESSEREEIIRIVRGAGTVEDKVLSLKRVLPSMRPQEIAEYLDISREWARRLLQRNGKGSPTVNTWKVYCPKCNKQLEKTPKRGMCRECYAKVANINIQCAGCGTWINRPRTVYNRQQSNKRYRGNMYCSRECFDNNKLPYRRERTTYDHVCEECGKVTTVYGAYEKRKAKARKTCGDECYSVSRKHLSYDSGINTGHKYSEEIMSMAKSMYSNGSSARYIVKEISEKIGRNPSTGLIYQWSKKHNWIRKDSLNPNNQWRTMGITNTINDDKSQ